MCCVRLDTDVLLANYFAEKGLNRDTATMEDLTLFLDFLSDCLPGYVSSDLSEERVQECAERYPGYYHLSWRAHDTLIVQPGKARPAKDYFNRDYSADVAMRIEEMTNLYRSLDAVYVNYAT